MNLRTRSGNRNRHRAQARSAGGLARINAALHGVTVMRHRHGLRQVVNSAPTAGEGARLRRRLSAMITAGIAAGYLASPRLREVHWQAAGRAAPGPPVSIAGESAQFVDPAEIPDGADVGRLGQALARGRYGDLGKLMANTAAYTGLRQGELFALTTDQVAAAARVITVDRKVVEVSGKLFLEAPKSRKRRGTVYSVRTRRATRWQTRSPPDCRRPGLSRTPGPTPWD
jgi:integrase